MNENEIKTEIEQVDAQAGAIIVNDKETFEVAGQMVISLDALTKKINAYWEDPIKKAFEAHRALTAKRAEMLKPVDDRRKNLKNKISAYLTEQERIRQEEQRRVDEERRKREQAEREKLERAAVRAEEKGQDEKAEALREKAEDVYVPPVVVVSDIQKTTRTDAGTITGKKDIQITVTDPKAILKAVVDGTLPIGIININETKLKQAIKLAGLTRLDGCEIKEIVSAQFRAS